MDVNRKPQLKYLRKNSSNNPCTEINQGNLFGEWGFYCLAGFLCIFAVLLVLAKSALSGLGILNWVSNFMKIMRTRKY